MLWQCPSRQLLWLLRFRLPRSQVELPELALLQALFLLLRLQQDPAESVRDGPKPSTLRSP